MKMKFWLAVLLACLIPGPPLLAEPAARTAPPGWEQLALAGGITVNQAVPDPLSQLWVGEIAANDRHYANDLGLTPASDPKLFRRGHAPFALLHGSHPSQGRTMAVSILQAANVCDPDHILPSDAAYDLCPAKITVTEGGSTRAALVRQVCWYDATEDSDYRQQPAPNGTFVRFDEATRTVHFGVWERGKAVAACAKFSKLP